MGNSNITGLEFSNLKNAAEFISNLLELDKIRGLNPIYVPDVLDLSGHSDDCHYTDYKFGWKNLDGVKITISFPKPDQLD